MGFFSEIFDDILGFDPNGGGIYGVARDILGDTIADDILGMDPNGGGAIGFYNSVGPSLLTAGAASAITPYLGNFFGGTSGTVGPGISAAGSAGYGSIGANSSWLGAGAAETATGFAGGNGLMAPMFTGGGAGLVGSLGTSSGAITQAAGGSPGLLSGLSGYLPAAQSLANIASGLYGMNLAGDARTASDPFAPYRPVYAQQLAALELNPGSITTRPGFLAGLDTIKRKSASTGYYGSGNMASALSRYSGDFYNQEAARLASLAGAGQTPGAGQTLGADLASKSLGSIGYGLNSLTEPVLKSVGNGISSFVGKLFGG